MSSPPDRPAGPGALSTPAIRDTQTGIDVGRRLAPGTLVAGRYRIARLLGIGGMGLVYLAADETLGIDVALKVLRPDLGGDPEWAARFRRELLLAREVTHRNVVRIHDIGEHDGLLYITMQYVAGRPLSAVLAEDGPLEPARAAAIGAQVASGLQDAHDAGIVHRDLKPANILLAEDGTAYVTDFGVARSRTREALTREGAVVGTPDYLSPEQISGDPIDGRSDLYALGIVLYELVTGQLPFRGTTQTEQLAQRLTGQVRRVADTGARVPAWFEAVVRRCLERDPARRYAQGRDLAADLLAHRGTTSWRPSRRMALAAGLLVTLGAGAALVLRPRAPGEIASAPVKTTAGAAAVLPFLNETGDVGLDWAGSAVSEMLSAQLAEDARLRVVDALRVERTLADLHLAPGPGAEPQLRRLAELLEVDRVVTGTLRRAGSTLRLDARLVARDGAPATVSAEAAGEAELFAAVARLGAAVRGRLDDGGPAATAEEPPTTSLAAARAYAEGLAALGRGDAGAAVKPLEAAVAADPAYAAALERLAEAYQATGREPKAVETARRAIEAAPAGSRRALRARARLAMLEGRPEESSRLFADLVRRFPRDVEALLDLAAAQGAQGDVGKAVETLRQATEVDRREPRAWFLLGKNEILSGDAPKAVNQDLLQALTLQTQLQNEAGRGDVLNALGVGWHQLGDYPRALDNYSQAAAIRAKLEDARGTAVSLKNRGRVLVAMGRFDEAEPDLRRAQAGLGALGDRAAVASVLDDLGVLQEGRGDFARARTAYQEALAIRRGLGDERQLAQSFDNVGYILFLQGDYDGAGVYWQQALGLRTKLGDKGGEILSRQNLGFLQTAQGHWPEATKTFVATLEESRRIEFKNAIAVAHGNLGILHQLDGRPRAAQQSFEQALAAFKELGDARGEAEFAIRSAAAFLEVGDASRAAPRLASAGELVKRTGNHEQAADLLVARAAAARLAGDVAAARQALADAVREANASHGTVALLRARVAQAELDAVQGRGDPKAVDELRREASKLGDVLLALRAAVALAQVRSTRGELADAVRLLDGALREAGRLGWAAGLPALHAARAAAHAKAGYAAEASADWRRAREAADRVRADMDEATRAAFDALPVARAIAEGTRG